MLMSQQCSQGFADYGSLTSIMLQLSTMAGSVASNVITAYNLINTIIITYLERRNTVLRLIGNHIKIILFTKLPVAKLRFKTTVV